MTSVGRDREPPISRHPGPTSRRHARRAASRRDPRGTSTSRASPWTQTLQPVFAFSSNPSTSNTTDCPATRREQRVARCAVDDLAGGVRGVVHGKHVRRPVDDEPHPPDAPGRELRGALRLGQDLEAGGSVHHRYPLRSSGRLGADEATSGDRDAARRAPNGASRRQPKNRRRGARLRSHVARCAVPCTKTLQPV